MAFKAKVFIDGTDYTVVEYNLSGLQNTDQTQKPASIPMVEHIALSVEANSNVQIWHWFVSPEIQYSGKIVFYQDTDMASPMRTVTFKKAYCVDYDESYKNSGNALMLIDFVITAAEIDINGVPYKKRWG